VLDRGRIVERGQHSPLLAVDTLIDALTASFSAWERFTRAGPDGQSLADAMAGQWVNEALADTEHAGQIGARVAVMRGTPQDW